ncbi:hypothetical protein JCM19379_13230 [Methyloparacoccus murrellii]
MNHTTERGILQAMLYQSSEIQMPRVLRIHRRLETGDRLNDDDLTFLYEVCRSVERMRVLVLRHPDYEDYCTRSVYLLREISSLALANERA